MKEGESRTHIGSHLNGFLVTYKRQSISPARRP
jgi:hypothetical protein